MIEENTESYAVFISMPFAALSMPSLGLSILSTLATQKNVRNSVQYLTIDFAEIIGTSLYNKIAAGYPATQDLLGEWIFSGTLWPEDKQPSSSDYFNNVLRGKSPDHTKSSSVAEITDDFLGLIENAREATNQYLNRCADKILNLKPTIVGFTSVFQQHTASLALAKIMKRKAPHSIIVFGGANCEFPMGHQLAFHFPFVDIVVSGEAEIIFPQLLDSLLSDNPLPQSVSISYSSDFLNSRLKLAEPYNNDKNNYFIPIAKFKSQAKKIDEIPEFRLEYKAEQTVEFDLNNSEMPSFEDYFLQLSASNLSQSVFPRLLYESSRGCWWGEKNHCTFCGLNGGSMKYRSKNGEKVLTELNFLNTKYPNIPISMVDNILDMSYFKSLLPALAARDEKIELFYEVKANLKKSQIRQLKAAGITMIQPGIESFSTHILKVMKKGVSSLQNIQLLKWCKEIGVHAEWNLLFGFPGETEMDYTNMFKLLKNLTHLTPPSGVGKMRMDRYSPNFERSTDLGFCNIKPYSSYEYVYPLAPDQLYNMAYYFSFDYLVETEVDSYANTLSQQVERWKSQAEFADLFIVEKGQSIIVVDLRPGAINNFSIYTGLSMHCLLLCDQITSISNIIEKLHVFGLANVEPESLTSTLLELCERGFMVSEDNCYLCIAMLTNDMYEPSYSTLQVLAGVITKDGALQGNGDIVINPNCALSA